MTVRTYVLPFPGRGLVVLGWRRRGRGRTRRSHRAIDLIHSGSLALAAGCGSHGRGSEVRDQVRVSFRRCQESLALEIVVGLAELSWRGMVRRDTLLTVCLLFFFCRGEGLALLSPNSHVLAQDPDAEGGKPRKSGGVPSVGFRGGGNLIFFSIFTFAAHAPLVELEVWV